MSWVLPPGRPTAPASRDVANSGCMQRSAVLLPVRMTKQFSFWVHICIIRIASTSTVIRAGRSWHPYVAQHFHGDHRRMAVGASLCGMRINTAIEVQV